MSRKISVRQTGAAISPRVLGAGAEFDSPFPDFMKMSLVRGPPHLTSVPNSNHIAARTETSTSSERASLKLSDAALFAVLWKELSDMVGTAAAAILFKRALRRALPRSPELAELRITRDNMDYGFAIPACWNELRSDSPSALRELGKELWTLLVALTGTVVVNRLASVAELRASGIFEHEGIST